MPRSGSGRTSAHPEVVDGGLDLEVPDERADDREQEPQAPDRLDRRGLAFALVHGLELDRDHEPHDRVHEDGEHDADRATEAFAAVLLEVLALAVGPDEGPDPEGDDRHEDRHSEVGGLPDGPAGAGGTRPAGGLHGVAHARSGTRPGRPGGGSGYVRSSSSILMALPRSTL